MPKRISNFCPFLTVHQDCFALQADNHCFALQDTEFRKETACPFYKQQNEVDPRIARKKNDIDRNIRMYERLVKNHD